MCMAVVCVCVCRVLCLSLTINSYMLGIIAVLYCRMVRLEITLYIVSTVSTASASCALKSTHCLTDTWWTLLITRN